MASAHALVVTAGAGMGVDSGLPDFRGVEGFWEAYPPYKKLGLKFADAANPEHFATDPALGWGFYGHRLRLYRDTEPHPGFGLILSWVRRFRLDFFVITSNVDGHFQKAGFPAERIHEVHGSIHHAQCSRPCRRTIWPHTEDIPVEAETMRAQTIPPCPHCGAVARPNILMFGDWSWLSDRSDAQALRFERFWGGVPGGSVVVLEMGAGTEIPTIRRVGERLAAAGGLLVRINTRECDVPPGQIALPAGALEALRAIDGGFTGN